MPTSEKDLKAMVDALVSAYARGTDPMATGEYRTQPLLRADARNMIRALRRAAWDAGFDEGQSDLMLKEDR